MQSKQAITHLLLHTYTPHTPPVCRQVSQKFLAGVGRGHRSFWQVSTVSQDVPAGVSSKSAPHCHSIRSLQPLYGVTHVQSLAATVIVWSDCVQ